MIIDTALQPDGAISDRAFQYGDACFTTMAFRNGSIAHLPAHLNRMQTACERLKIPFTDWQRLEQHLADLAINEEQKVVKLIISRGSGGRGYGIQGADSPVAYLSQHPMPAHYAQLQQDGVHVGLSPIQLGHQPLLAGLKHNNRLEQVLIKADPASANFDDVLVTDIQGMLVEASAANLIWCQNGCWFSPDLSLCGVEGIMKGVVSNWLASHGKTLHQVRAMPSVLQNAEAVFITNALMGVIPVREFTCESNSYRWIPAQANALLQDFQQYLTEQTQSGAGD